jgi:hypothetical protein
MTSSVIAPLPDALNPTRLVLSANTTKNNIKTYSTSYAVGVIYGDIINTAKFGVSCIPHFVNCRVPQPRPAMCSGLALPRRQKRLPLIVSQTTSAVLPQWSFLQTQIHSLRVFGQCSASSLDPPPHSFPRPCIVPHV